jgi:ABC-type branched-subunit amino acid transport system permease subunit
MPVARNFLLIVAAALGSSVAGALFAIAVAWVSPELVKSLFSPPAAGSLTRYAAGVGMIWGLFLGAAVMSFSLLIASLTRLARAIQDRRTEDSDRSERESR